MKIVSDYSGGNIIYKGCEEKDGYTEIFLEQDIRDTDGWWFYWNFRIDSPPAGKVRFTFCNRNVVCPYGAAVSENVFDWRYDESGYEDATHFNYTFDGSGKSMYFAFTLPYQTAHFEKFFSRISCDKAVERKTLTVSEEGRDIPLILFGSGEKDVVFTARHHACESTASYVLEGLIDAMLGEYRLLLEKYRFHIIPFVDIDGVENGDQGKGRKPHDHNRDYIDESIYKSTAAIMDYSKNLNVSVFIDFHSPWRWGGADSRPHIHLGSFENNKNETEMRFVRTLKEITEQPGFSGIRYDGYVNFLGSRFNPDECESASSWFLKKCGAELSFTIETPYSGDLEAAYTLDLLREWGKNIAETFAEIFAES